MVNCSLDLASATSVRDSFITNKDKYLASTLPAPPALELGLLSIRSVAYLLGRPSGGASKFLIIGWLAQCTGAWEKRSMLDFQALGNYTEGSVGARGWIN